MSFSLFGDVLELSVNDDDSSSSSSTDNPRNTSVVRPEDLNDTTIGSESGLSFSDGQYSFDSSALLEDFGSTVSLPAGTLAQLLEGNLQRESLSIENIENIEEHTRSTIVSSAASGAHIPAPEASQDLWAISPHPRLVLDKEMEAISTICTETLSYQRLTLDDVASVLSLPNEVNSSSFTSMPTSAHQRATFEAIANRLLQVDDGEISFNSKRTKQDAWFSRFTDADWEQLRHVAKIVLASSGSQKKLWSLPPCPPMHTYIGPNPRVAQPLTHSCRADLFVSPSFLCAFCKDILVGALTLDCGCTMCTVCWEQSNNASLPLSNSVFAKQEGYVWVDTKTCPNCGSTVNSTIPCQPLDVAICQVVDDLENHYQEDDGPLSRFKEAYYARLEVWRETVVARNELIIEQHTIEEDEMLARLIQEEEELLWRRNGKSKSWMTLSTGIWLVLSQAAVAVLAGTLSSVALQAFAKRR